MSDNDVRIVTLEPMRVASFHGFGNSPEYEAMEKLIAWAKPRGLLTDERKGRVFGFNNPDPSPGSPNYGYEFWLELGPEVSVGDEVEVKRFPGGQYAVLRCHALPDGGNIFDTWQKLATWQAASRYRHRRQRQWLEEHIGPLAVEGGDFILDLYLPVGEEE